MLKMTMQKQEYQVVDNCENCNEQSQLQPHVMKYDDKLKWLCPLCEKWLIKAIK